MAIPKQLLKLYKSGILGSRFENAINATEPFETIASILQQSPESLEAAYTKKALDQDSSAIVPDVV